MKLSTEAKSGFQIYHVQTDVRNEMELQITICNDNERDNTAAYQPGSSDI